MSARAITLSFTRIKKRAGTDFRFHDLRHEAISRFFEMDMSPIEVASISGHRTLKQLMRYSHADTDRLVAKMQESLS
jgi:integrase